MNMKISEDMDEKMTGDAAENEDMGIEEIKTLEELKVKETGENCDGEKL